MPPSPLGHASVRSWPDENARPSPVSTMQRTLASPSAPSSARRRSACMAAVKALSLSGRASAITATPSLVWVRTVGSAMGKNSPRQNHQPAGGGRGRDRRLRGPSKAHLQTVWPLTTTHFLAAAAGAGALGAAAGGGGGARCTTG